MSTFITSLTKLFTLHQKTTILMLMLMHTAVTTLVAQQNDTTAAIIQVELKNNKADFNSILRPLQKIPGAPEAFYAYFWEFGDGNFSFEQTPKHVYKDTGLYNVRLYATNNYDDGKPPPTRPKPIKVHSMSNYAVSPNPSFFKEGGTIEMKVNRMPRTDEDMVLVLGYRNENKSSSLGGSLVLFYNEKQFHKDNFNLEDERTYNNETRSPLSSVIAYAPPGNIIENSSFSNTGGPNINTSEGLYSGKFAELIGAKQKLFRTNVAWRFSNLQKGDEKYFFLTLHTTPGMIKDTNAVVVLDGMFVPDDPNAEIEEYALELQIVASHDPNRMMLRNQRLNYRFTGDKKDLIYKVAFQNTGKGPSRQIAVGISVPVMMDPHSVEIIEVRPKCISCRSAREGQPCLDTLIGKDSIYFIFKNIYLQGLRQQGFTDIDSTNGYIKYRMHFNRQLKKLPFESGASIVFDKNEALRTNGTKGNFKPGNSPAVMLGYSKLLAKNAQFNQNENYWSIGASISPYSPYKRYLQAEIQAGFMNNPEELVDQVQNKDTSINNALWLLAYRNTYEKSKVVRLDLVPLEVRYNFMDYLGAGIGTQVSVDAFTSASFHQDMLLIKQSNGQPMMTSSDWKKTYWFKRFDMAIFADLQVGKVRNGPVAGIRFLHYFRFPQNRFFFYAACRF